MAKDRGVLQTPQPDCAWQSSPHWHKIPRVFTFLATMDSAEITKLLDESPFTGPARLAPIADAIHKYSVGCSRSHLSEIVKPLSAPTNAEEPKDP